MTVLRIVANLSTPDPNAARAFYQDFLGLEPVMDHGWIITFAAKGEQTPQISAASQGGGSPVPEISVEVDDVDAAHAKAVEAGFVIARALRDEPWGVRRFFVWDPAGRLVNILSHL
ncbi:MAG: VOC family protein [Paracoccaceae bacterium]